MKRLLLIAALAAPVSAATTYGDWMCGDDVCVTASDRTPVIQAASYRDKTGHINVGIVLPSDECPEYSDGGTDAGVSNVNGRTVNMLRQCLGNNQALFYSYDRYILNQFKTQTQVCFDNIMCFSARGFIKAISRGDI